MAGLQVLSPLAVADDDMPVQRSVTTILDTGTTRNYASDLIASRGATYATLDYVNLADSAFQTPGQVDTADALNLPLTARGAVNGVATLDASGYVPLAQCPNLGVGFLKGPYGVTSQITSDISTSSQAQLAQIDLGSTGTAVTFKPMAYATVFMQQSTGGVRAVLEMRIGDATQTTYASQTLVSAGTARGGYLDFQPISAGPVGTTTGQVATAGLSPNTHWIITLWLTSSGGVSVVKTGNILTCSAYLLRVIQ